MNKIELATLDNPVCEKGQNSWKWGCKILSWKRLSGNEGARTRDRWGHSGNEGAKNEQRKYKFCIKHIIVEIDALFELYLAIICSMYINTSQIVNEKA